MSLWFVGILVVTSAPIQAGLESRSGSTVVEVAGELASEVHTLSDWPPYSALRNAPDTLRRAWRDRLLIATAGGGSDEDWLLASVLLEILAVAEEFDECGLAGKLVSPPQCYQAWLRYRLGWDLTAQEVHRMAVEAEARFRPVRDATGMSATWSWPGMDAVQFVRELTDSVQVADRNVRLLAGPVVPFEADHDQVSVRVAAGPPVASYLGVDPAGRPIVRIDTATARLWGPSEISRIVAHEVWPGHHLLSTLAAEPMHPVLQGVGWDGFSEGWSTYAEALATTDEVDHPVPAEMAKHLLRLALLAQVDVGLHAGGWAIDQAIDALTSRGGYPGAAALAAATVIESNPGHQASYFVGYFALLSIRDAAVGAAGGSFELRGFHRTILQHGNLPLGVVRELALRRNARG